MAPKASRTAGKGGKDACPIPLEYVQPMLTGAAILAGAALAYAGGTMAYNAYRDAQDAPLTEVTLAMIKPDATKAGRTAEIKADIAAAGFKVLACKEVTFTDSMVDAFYAEHVGKSFYPGLKAFMTSGPCEALALQRVGAIKAWRALMGPTNTATACAQAPQSLRAKYGFDGTKNATHGSDSPESALRELSFHFPSCETTLAIVKAGDAAQQARIKADVLAAGFTIVRQSSGSELTTAEIDAFCADPSVPVATNALLRGHPVLAMALRKDGAITAWKALMGPEAVYGSADFTAAARDLYCLFPPVETTLAMIKPDAVGAGSAGAIKARARAAGFRIVACRKYQLTSDQVDFFYAEHAERPFFPALKAFMTSGPIIAMALRKPGAIAAWRKLMGPTSTETAKKEDPSSLRAHFGTDNTRNATHGSDSHEAAARELSFHFPEKAALSFWGFQWF